MEDKEFYKAFAIDYNTGNVIERLIDNSLLSEEKKRYYLSLLNNGMILENEAEDLISLLKENQIDPINAGKIYNQTDIKNKLRNESN
jgi:putative IMPACT (imprinted ancient) family translation regulator